MLLYRLVIVLYMFGVITIIYAKNNLPPCHQIPKLLCCTESVLDKCLSGCIAYVTDKCPQKLHKFEKIMPTTTTTTLSPVDNVNILNFSRFSYRT